MREDRQPTDWFRENNHPIRSTSGETNPEESGKTRAEEANPSHPDLFGLTITGKRPANEDAILTVATDRYHLLAVADGLGGHAAGEYASDMVIGILEEEMERALSDQMGTSGMSTSEIEAMLRDIHIRIHGAIKQESTGEQKGMGTTLVSALIRNNDAVIGNTGDSRAYLIGERVGGEKVVLLTRDHSVVQSLIDEGIIDKEGASSHPLRNILSHSMGGTFTVDTFHQPLSKGDILFLCSDGFSGFVKEEDIPGAIAGKTAEEAANTLVKMAEEGESDDNISVVVYRHGSGY